MATHIGTHAIGWYMNGENHVGKCLLRRVKQGLSATAVGKIQCGDPIDIAIRVGLGILLLEATGYWVSADRY